MTWLAETIAGESEGVFEVPEMEQELRETYLRRFALNVSGGMRSLNEAKMVVIGPAGAGKTSLVERLIFDTYSPQTSTHGTLINSWVLNINEENIQLNVWDFGGQEIMHGTHRFFLTARSCYLLVLNTREKDPDSEAEYWLKLVQSYSNDSPVIIVLNKVKESFLSINKRALVNKYPMIKAFVETDCKDGTGIEELRRIIEQEVSNLESTQALIPAEWFAIKEIMIRSDKYFLTRDEYRHICREYGERSEEAQNTLARYLHDLGIILSFEDNPRLEEIVIGNPMWLMSGIYQVLDSVFLSRQHGQISLSELSEILTNYPRSIHHYLLDVMKKFELCFSFPDDESRYLFPDMLINEEPNIEFDREKCLNFEYHYSFLPPALIPRFIVRTYRLVYQSQYWRTGVILQFEDCLAMVKLDALDRKVLILIKGQVESRRRMLAVIRSDFEGIHSSTPNLEIKEMIPIPANPSVTVLYDTLLTFEKNKMDTFPIVINDQVVELDIRELLAGIDLPKHSRQNKKAASKIRIFLSYSHKDEVWQRELATHLKILQRQGLIDEWADRTIEAGEDWKLQINEKLDRADIILLLVSADYLASDYDYGVEMARALNRQKNGEATVIPIILRDVNWQSSPLGKLQALPKDGIPISQWRDRDSAWRSISEGIEKAADLLRSKKR